MAASPGHRRATHDSRDALVRDASGKPAHWLVEMGGSAASPRGHLGQGCPAARSSASVRAVAERATRRCASGPAVFPARSPPAAGMQCDSVEGHMALGGAAGSADGDLEAVAGRGNASSQSAAVRHQPLLQPTYPRRAFSWDRRSIGGSGAVADPHADSPPTSSRQR